MRFDKSNNNNLHVAFLIFADFYAAIDLCRALCNALIMQVITLTREGFNAKMNCARHLLKESCITHSITKK